MTPGIYIIVDKTKAGEGTTNSDGSKVYTHAAIIAMTGTGINSITKLSKDCSDSDATTLGQVEYKANGTVTPTKKTTGVQSSDHGGVNSDKNAADNAIGKTETFQISTTVPNWNGYSHFYFGVNDHPSKGLTFVASSVHVKVNGTALDSQYYTVTPTADTDGPTDVKIEFGQKNESGTFTGDIIPVDSKFPVNAPVVVTYNVMINKDAVSKSPLTNKATVEYSRNPNSWNNHDITPPSNTKTYTGKVQFHKTAVNSTTGLSGAQFELYERNKNTEGNLVKATDPLKVVKESAGKYHLYDGKETVTPAANLTDTLVTDDSGNISIEGVDGTYELVETKAPEGYNSPVLADVTFKVTVSQDDGTYAVTDIHDSNALAEPTTGDADTVHVINAHNITEMPQTGEAGIIMDVIIALILAAIGVTIAFATKRHAARR